MMYYKANADISVKSRAGVYEIFRSEIVTEREIAKLMDKHGLCDKFKERFTAIETEPSSTIVAFGVRWLKNELGNIIANLD